MVRHRALARRAPRPDHLRQGRDQRLSPARRRDRRRRGRRAVLRAARAARCCATAPRTPGIRRCCAAALAVLDIYEAEDMIARGRELEGPLQRRARAAGRPSGGGGGARRARACSAPSPCRRTALAADPAAVGQAWPRARARPACSCGRCSAPWRLAAARGRARAPRRARARASGRGWTASTARAGARRAFGSLTAVARPASRRDPHAGCAAERVRRDPASRPGALVSCACSTPRSRPAGRDERAARPAAIEVPVAQARAAHEAETAALSGPGEPVAEVRDIAVPGAGGDVPVRVYRPAAAVERARRRRLLPRRRLVRRVDRGLRHAVPRARERLGRDRGERRTTASRPSTRSRPRVEDARPRSRWLGEHAARRSAPTPAASRWPATRPAATSRP